MKFCKLACCLSVLVSAKAFADSEGWQNVDPSRKFPAPVREIWRASFEDGLKGFTVDWRDGATGEVAVVSRNGRKYLGIRKRNSSGCVVVTAPNILSLPPGTRLQAAAGCESDNADCEYSYGFLCVWNGPEDLSYRSLGPYGRGGPKMTQIANTPSGFPDRKLAHGEVKGDGPVSVAIVVAGAASTSVWSEWTVEDFMVAQKEWTQKVRNRRPPSTDGQKELSDAEFDAFVADSADHTAKVVTRDGYSTFLVDGKAKPPVFFKGSTSVETKGFYGGAKMAEAGMDLQSVSVRLGTTKRADQGKGYWSKDGFDVKGAVAQLWAGMKRAPKAKYLLSVDVSAYPEFCDEHPEETWINDFGQRVFGHNVHSGYFLPKKMGPQHWYWPSNHSLVWREAAKTRLAELIDELKRTGLSKLIVGVHLAGYHDGQFATVHPDYSKPAIAAFRRWLKEKYGTVEALRAAWGDPAADFESATPKVFHANYGTHPYFLLPQDRPLADFAAFLKKGPLLMQEDFSRHVKRCFGKDIVTVRYCMSPFGGTFCSAYDITPFLKSDTIDVLCAQPDYGRRVPGVPIGNRLPMESFHANGKMFFNEFDLRTYGAMTSWESELAALSYSRADDDAMFATIDRKLAGQMYARRMGWWYLDMAGGWFEPDGVASDIAGVLAVGRELGADRPSAWRPDVAFVTDEDGALLRNTFSQYYNPDESVTLGRQVQTLAASGVPCDGWVLEDWLENPSLADRYRTIVFWGLYEIDAKREKLLSRLMGGRRTLVFLAGTGRSSGIGKLGFGLGEKRAPAQHGTCAEPGVGWNMTALVQEPKITSYMGVTNGWMWLLNSPTRLYLTESPSQKVLARFTEDGTVAVAERKDGRSKLVYVASYGGLTPEYFHHLALESGAYVPTDGCGLEVDMNGDFVSVHCLVPGAYAFRLPFKAKVANLKTGEVFPAATEFRMRLTAGETRWYRLRRED